MSTKLTQLNPVASPRPSLSPRLPLRVAAATLFISTAVFTAGCTTPMLRPGIDVPADFAASPKSTAAESAEAAWWSLYGDPVLAALVERAARENRDVLIAAERVRAARAGATVSRSWLLPGVSLQANGSRSNNEFGSEAQAAIPESEGSSAGLAASWEIDLSGRLRAGAKAAAADAEAAEGMARGVRLMVLSDVATNYFTLAGALRQLEAMKEISGAQDESLRLVTARERVGLASPFDVQRVRADAERLRAAIPRLESAVAVSRHRLAVLVGDLPETASNLTPWSGDVVVPDVAAGQPARLLERRPDLLSLKAQLEASNWRRRQAVAEWFPRVVASALFGRQDVDFNGHGLGSARFGNVAGFLSMPVFDYGRTKAINQSADAAQRESLLRYEDGIARALEDVENALVQLQSGRQRSKYMDASARSADAALGHATSLHERGQVDLLPLLDARRIQLQARMAANDAETELLIASVQLFKALGGGWQAFEPALANELTHDGETPNSNNLAATTEDSL